MSIGWNQGGGGFGLVTSVFGRTGAVTAQAGDYSALQVSAAGPLGATNVQDVLNSLATQSSYETIWDFNFTTATPGAIVNGAQNIDGQIFNAAFVGNASQFEIVGGTGLVITATAGVSRNFTGPVTDDAPVIWINMTDLPALASEWARNMTLWIRLGALSLPVANNAVYWGLWMIAGTGYSNLANGAGWVRIGVNTGPMVQRGSTRIQCAPGGYGHMVQACRYPAYDQRYFDSWSIASSPGPDFPDNLDGFLQVGAESAMNGNTISGTALPHVPGSRLAIAVPTNAATGAPSVTVEQIAITVGPPQQ